MKENIPRQKLISPKSKIIPATLIKQMETAALHSIMQWHLGMQTPRIYYWIWVPIQIVKTEKVVHRPIAAVQRDNSKR